MPAYTLRAPLLPDFPCYRYPLKEFLVITNHLVKSNIPILIPFLIFSSLGIPTWLLWRTEYPMEYSTISTVQALANGPNSKLMATMPQEDRERGSAMPDNITTCKSPSSLPQLCSWFKGHFLYSHTPMNDTLWTSQQHMLYALRFS